MLNKKNDPDMSRVPLWKKMKIKCLTNKRHFLSEDKSFYTIYTNLYSNPPKNYTNL